MIDADVLKETETGPPVAVCIWDDELNAENGGEGVEIADARPVEDTAVPLLTSDAEARVPDMVSEEAVWLSLSDVAVLVEVLAGGQRVDSVTNDDDTLGAMELDEFNDTMVLATFEDTVREVPSELGE